MVKSDTFEVPEPVQTEGKKQPQPEANEPCRVLCGDVSPCGAHLVLCDDRKQMTLWDCRDWSLKKQWNLQRRANQVLITKDLRVILADKSGDVFLFQADEEDEGRLVLGHLSMLLGLALTDCGKYIVTCDRDEKIRVSHFPNAYNIHNYCLGHTDFVTSVGLFPSKPELLASSSGDGTIRLWDFLGGKELCCRICCGDAGLEPLPSQENEEEADQQGDHKNGDSREEDLRSKRKSDYPAVKSLKTTEVDSKLMAAVSVEGLRGILVYEVITEADSYSWAFRQKIELAEAVWDFGFDNDGALWMVDKANLTVFRKPGGGADLFQVEEASRPSETISNLLKECKDYPEKLPELHKRWFDNMKEYMARKEERMAKKAKTT